MTVFERASMRNTQSALRYETVPTSWDGGSWSNGDNYYTSAPFKGFHANSDGIVAVIGIDDAWYQFTVKSGCTYPYGGIGISPLGTTLTISDPANFILLF